MGTRISTDIPGRFSGMGPFLLVWSGQAVSLAGSAAVRFAFIVEVWSSGGNATAVTVLSLCAMLPQAVFSPIAGAIVDRMTKRAALQIADAGGLLVVGTLALLHYLGAFHAWQVYPATVLLGVCAAFQFPALSSAVPLLVRKDQLDHTNGLLVSAKSAAGIGGPALGGLLFALFGIGPTLLVDLASYAFALIGIRIVRFNGDRVAKKDADSPRRRITADALEGLRYLFRVPSLRDLIINFCVVNLVMVFGFALISPMVLLRAYNGALAAVNTSVGIGGVAGALLMAAWGGPANRGRGMMLGVVGMCLSGLVVMGLVTGVVELVPGHPGRRPAHDGGQRLDADDRADQGPPRMAGPGLRRGDVPLPDLRPAGHGGLRTARRPRLRTNGHPGLRALHRARSARRPRSGQRHGGHVAPRRDRRDRGRPLGTRQPLDQGHRRPAARPRRTAGTGRASRTGRTGRTQRR